MNFHKMIMIRNISKLEFHCGYSRYFRARYFSSCENKPASPSPSPSPTSLCPPQPCPSVPNCAILGKNALITGAANGIGLAAAKSLLNAGANKVCMLDIDEKNGECASKELNEEYGRDCTCFQKVDITCHEEFEEAFKKCVKWVKKLDIVFNNAGILNDHKWAETVAINTTGMIRGTIFAFKYMGLDQGGCGGIVVNNASILGLQPLAGCPVYVGTKHAAVGMTRSWGTPFWFDRTGIKFMAILPGVTDTNMITGAHGPDDPLTKELAKGLDSLPPQPVSKCGEHFVTILTKGTNGSLWISENGETYEVEIPNRSTLKHVK